jgi:Flp pilus assembly secretin CpaC
MCRLERRSALPVKQDLGGLILLTMLVFGTIGTARAADDTVTLGLGAASRLQLGQAFATVLVGDPAVVDVRTDDDRSVVIEARHAGVTNLVFIDARGLVTANIRVSVSPDNTAHAVRSDGA